jgi:hypothetical protein
MPATLLLTLPAPRACMAPGIVVSMGKTLWPLTPTPLHHPWTSIV